MNTNHWELSWRLPSEFKTQDNPTTCSIQHRTPHPNNRQYKTHRPSHQHTSYPWTCQSIPPYAALPIRGNKLTSSHQNIVMSTSRDRAYTSHLATSPTASRDQNQEDLWPIAWEKEISKYVRQNEKAEKYCEEKGTRQKPTRHDKERGTSQVMWKIV